MAQNYAGAAKARLTRVAVLGILVASSTILRAQNILPLSPQCEAPVSDIATQASLPHLATALQFRKSLRVMAIGSSSTFGLGASLGKSYPAQLAEMLEKSLKGVNIEVVNRGISGEVAKTTAERLRLEIPGISPDLVLWQLGTNDALAGVPVVEFEATVRETIDWLKQRNIDVVLIGLQYTPNLAKNRMYSAVRDMLRRIAREEGILYVRRFEAMRYISTARSQLVMDSGDGLHLNDIGYRCMAEHIGHAVVANVFSGRFAVPEPGDLLASGSTSR